jgi:uncharacterized membrane protein YraQ (UPF0718 family)
MLKRVNIPLDEIASKLAAIGVPSLVLITTIATSGLTGAAAITASLAILGPGGMISGIVTLLVAGTITGALTQYGLDKLLKAVTKELYKRGKTKGEIISQIDKYHISKSQKLKIKEAIENF